MTKGQYDYLSKMKDGEVQMTSLRSFILVKSKQQYKLYLIFITDAIGLCLDLDFPRAYD